MSGCDRGREVQHYQYQNGHRAHEELSGFSNHGHHNNGGDNGGAAILLSTPGPNSRDSNQSGRWRNRRRRSPSRRQRIHASLLRQFSPRRRSPSGQPQTYSMSVEYAKCPLCQPRYSPSPDRLGIKPVNQRQPEPMSLRTESSGTSGSSGTGPRGRPPKPREARKQVDKKLSVDTLLVVDKRVAENGPKNPPRRSKSEYRHPKSPPRATPMQQHTKVYKIDLDEKPSLVHPQWNGHRSGGDVNGNHGYAEVAPDWRSSGSNKTDKSRTRSKSRSRYGQMVNNGLLTIWPGKEGVWLPQ